jgi:hypothetical protein
VPLEGTVEQLEIGRVTALWAEGTARGTFTVVGAGGAQHREQFEVSSGALLWTRGAMTYLLQGALDEDGAARLAADVV